MNSPSSPRRKIHYASFDEVLQDAERVVRSGAVTTGNWSLDQILGHLAIAMERSIDGFEGSAPWFIRVVARYFVKPRVLKHGMQPGFKLPVEAEKWAIPPAGGNPAQTLERLRRAISRLQAEPTRVPHPLFGPIPAAAWDRLHLRHAELHMSFVNEP